MAAEKVLELTPGMNHLLRSPLQNRKPSILDEWFKAGRSRIDRREKVQARGGDKQGCLASAATCGPAAQPVTQPDQEAADMANMQLRSFEGLRSQGLVRRMVGVYSRAAQQTRGWRSVDSHT